MKELIFSSHDKTKIKVYNKAILNLRKQGYRKIDTFYEFQDMYELYRKKGKKEIVVVKTLLS